MSFKIPSAFASVVVCMLTVGCAAQGSMKTAQAPNSPPPAATVPDYGVTEKVKSPDGRVEGEVVGAIVPGGKFSKLHVGMLMPEVLALVGGPDGMSTHETGKRWIPFYFGGDARRVEVFYKGEGCLTYTGGNAWGGGDNQLIRITATQRTDCTE